MKNLISLSALTFVALAATASASFAGTVAPVGAPAPLLGAGLPGLAILVASGAGYLAIRLRRRNRD
jgi:hypothetical protein